MKELYQIKKLIWEKSPNGVELFVKTILGTISISHSNKKEDAAPWEVFDDMGAYTHCLRGRLPTKKQAKIFAEQLYLAALKEALIEVRTPSFRAKIKKLTHTI